MIVIPATRLRPTVDRDAVARTACGSGLSQYELLTRFSGRYDQRQTADSPALRETEALQHEVPQHEASVSL